MFDEFEQFQRFQATWNAVRIERAVEVGLFTFGDSDLPYYLVTSSSGRDAAGKAAMVKVRRGNVTVSRARIITPDTMHPELRNFFEEHEETGLIEFLMSRTAAFSNLKLSNESGPEKIVTDTVEEAVTRCCNPVSARCACWVCRISIRLGKNSCQCSRQYSGTP